MYINIVHTRMSSQVFWCTGLNSEGPASFAAETYWLWLYVATPEKHLTRDWNKVYEGRVPSLTFAGGTQRALVPRKGENRKGNMG